MSLTTTSFLYGRFDPSNKGNIGVGKGSSEKRGVEPEKFQGVCPLASNTPPFEQRFEFEGIQRLNRRKCMWWRSPGFGAASQGKKPWAGSDKG